MIAGRTVIKAQVVVVFYSKTKARPLYQRVGVILTRFLVGGGGIEHVSLMLLIDNIKPMVYNVTKLASSKWATARSVHKDQIPCVAINLGYVDVDPEYLDSIKPIRFSLIRFLLYCKVTRFFLRWKPKRICTMKIVEIIRDLGLDVNYHVMPIDLLKELKENADDTDCWEG